MLEKKGSSLKRQGGRTGLNVKGRKDAFSGNAAPAIQPEEVYGLINRLNGESVEDIVSALSSLCDIARKAEGTRLIAETMKDHALLWKLLENGDPKVRKNTVRLLGRIGTEEDSTALKTALERENTRFVIPSMLLALGETGGETAKAALKAYRVPVASVPEEEKHCQQISEAYRKACAHLMPAEVTMVHSLSKPCRILLTHPQGFADVLLKELTDMGFPSKQVNSGVMTEAQDLDKLYKARSFFEALIPCSIVPADAASIAAAAKQGWSYFSTADSDGAPMLPYRVELKDYAGDRMKMIRGVMEAVGGNNSPSAYSFEIRIRFIKEERAAVYVKPTAVRDVRFDYRVGALPASIHPATAAAIAREAVAILGMEEGTLRAYDPCCGSGTMLVETARAFGRKSVMMGTDVAPNAVEIAVKNMEKACCNATILRKDCLRFEARQPFDLLITNLPFGNRVGTHDSIVPLYQGLVKKLPQLVRENGLAVLYTMEGKLLETAMNDFNKNVSRTGIRLSTVKLIRTDAGGLLPGAYFVRVCKEGKDA